MFCFVIIFVTTSAELKINDHAHKHALRQVILFKAALDYPGPNGNAQVFCLLYISVRSSLGK